MPVSVESLTQLISGNYRAVLSSGESFTVSLNIVADFSLYSGRELNDEEHRALSSEAGFDACYQRALRILSATAISERALFERLVMKGESEENAARAVSVLLDRHFLNDAELAKSVVRSCAAKGYGSRRIRDELYKRQIPKEYWDEALLELPEQDDTIDRLLASKLRSEEPDMKEIKKATDFLIRRGFSYGQIREALERRRIDPEY